MIGVCIEISLPDEPSRSLAAQSRSLEARSLHSPAVDEGPVIRARHALNVKPIVRAAAMKISPKRYFPAYAAYLARRENAGYRPPADPRYRLLIVNHYFDQDIAWLRRAGDDVAIYASGPLAELFRGTVEQNFIYHVMARAAGLL